MFRWRWLFHGKVSCLRPWHEIFRDYTEGEVRALSIHRNYTWIRLVIRKDSPFSNPSIRPLQHIITGSEASFSELSEKKKGKQVVKILCTDESRFTRWLDCGEVPVLTSLLLLFLLPWLRRRHEAPHSRSLVRRIRDCDKDIVTRLPVPEEAVHTVNLASLACCRLLSFVTLGPLTAYPA